MAVPFPLAFLLLHVKSMSTKVRKHTILQEALTISFCSPCLHKLDALLCLIPSPDRILIICLRNINNIPGQGWRNDSVINSMHCSGRKPFCPQHHCVSSQHTVCPIWVFGLVPLVCMSILCQYHIVFITVVYKHTSKSAIVVPPV